MKSLKSFAAFCLIAALCACLFGCVVRKEESISVEGIGVVHEPEFGGVYITLTIEEFNALGFRYGDSVNVKFSNGWEMNDIPYFSGYYVDAGERLLVAYPGYDYIKACINYGDDVWVLAGLSETDTAAVTLNERAKYLDVQEARDIHYSDNRSDYESDVIFANFRNVQVGGLKENVLYRSASPCDNQHNRAPYVDKLMEEAGVNTILNLSDNEEKIEGYIAAEGFDSPYFLSIYRSGGVIPLAMNMNYSSPEFKEKLVNGLTALSSRKGPFLVHCTEGKDRTGFVCMLLEAFAGASYEEIVADYMKTYDNYYHITQASDPSKYAVIKEKNIDSMLRVIAGEQAELAAVDYAESARQYLAGLGMSEEALSALHAGLAE